VFAPVDDDDDDSGTRMFALRRMALQFLCGFVIVCLSKFNGVLFFVCDVLSSI